MRESNPGPRGCARVHALLTNTLGLVSCSITLRKENKETLLLRFTGNGADGGGGLAGLGQGKERGEVTRTH